MSDIAIRVEHLSKRYRIGGRQQVAYRTFREAVGEAFLSPFRRLRRVLERPAFNVQPSNDPYIWALKDVSFEVRRGEVVGIIGRNGAGKTTLLKILSRITEPTEGYAEIRGRVGSLLEVGTGFHPELTGRENIYLNGAILGMKKAEIDRKFDEIVAFAEIEKFLDTPVKHYSSGMYVRLAFAVAAHLEPEILLVDEVLAVGDAAFQKKCLGKMGDVAREGRTVLFVSHQMNSIRRLCERCIWLDAGNVQMIDSVLKVVSAYETTTLSTRVDDGERTGNSSSSAQFLRWEVVEPRCEQPNWVKSLGPVTFKTVVRISKPVKRGTHGIALRNSDNQLIWGWATYNLTLDPGIVEFVYRLPGLPIRPGVYHFHVSLYDDTTLIDEWSCVPELIIATDPLTHPRDEWSGILNIPCDFRVCTEEDING